MSVTLRDYQEQAAAQFHEKLVLNDYQRGVLVLPTGGGKTTTALEIARRYGKRTLWLAHRQELIDQPFETLKDVWADADVGIVKAERNETNAKDVVIASIQTVSRNDCARLNACGQFGLVIVDECHHAIADSYVSVIERMGCMERGGPKLLGLTATPDRAGLKDLFDAGVIFNYPLKQAIDEGYLCQMGPTSQIRVPSLDLSKVKTAKGDFVQSSLGNAMLSEHVADFTAKGIRRQASDRRTIVFTVLVQQAVQTAEALKKLGMSAAVVSGETPEQERREILAKFYDGEIQVVCNASALTEGYDNPRIDCIVVARPTKSSILYRQMIGRGLRLHPDKSNLMVIDLVGASERFDVMSAPKFGRQIDLEYRASRSSSMRSTPKASTERFWLKGLLNADAPIGAPAPTETETAVAIERAHSVEPAAPISWLRSKKYSGWFTATPGGVVCVMQVRRSTASTEAIVWVVAVRGDTTKNIPHRLVGVFHSEKMAFGAGADCARKFMGSRSLKDIAEDEARRQEPVSEHQIKRMQNLGMQPSRYKNRGEAADAITVELGVRAGREIADLLRARGGPLFGEAWSSSAAPIGGFFASAGPLTTGAVVAADVITAAVNRSERPQRG